MSVFTIQQPFPILFVINPYYLLHHHHNKDNNNSFFYNSVYANPTLNPNLLRSGSFGHWVSAAGKNDRADRFKFSSDDEEEERGNNTKRVWWSDNSMDFEDKDKTQGGFGILEDSFDPNWIFKVLNAFGWMVPAIAISMLLGTGSTNTIFMALALPLAQSLFSFITDSLFGRGSVRTSKPNPRKKPFRRSRNGDYVKRDTKKDNEDYQFRKSTNDKPPKGAKLGSNFGGWDELDPNNGFTSYKVPRQEPNRMENEPELEEEIKLSRRRVRTRSTPLLVRLLIAVFPFLGSWTRLL